MTIKVAPVAALVSFFAAMDDIDDVVIADIRAARKLEAALTEAIEGALGDALISCDAESLTLAGDLYNTLVAARAATTMAIQVHTAAQRKKAARRDDTRPNAVK